MKTCTLCLVEKPLSAFTPKHKNTSQFESRCKVCRNRLQIQRFAVDRMLALQHYSGSKIPFCKCCGETVLNFLTFDHIGGGGGEHKRTEKFWSIGLWLRLNGYPEGFRVLCMNCNFSIGKYGFCPHGNLDT